MNEYRKLLVLQYLVEVNENYSIKEIFGRLGLEFRDGNQLLDEMFEEKLIEYKEYLIKITEKGQKKLKEAKSNYLKVYEGNIFVHDIVPKLKKDDIYIPNKF